MISVKNMVEDIKKAVDALIQAGEDEVELHFWQDIAPDLEEKDQRAILYWLEREIEDLKQLKGGTQASV